MKSDKSNPVSGVSNRQKITAGIFVVVIVIVVWQLISMMRGGGSSEATTPELSANTSGGMTATPGAPGMTAAAPAIVPPKQEVAPKQKPLTEAEAAMLRQQQELENTYIAAVNELQVLKVNKEIAETNQAIAKAKLDTVTSQKTIVDLLAPAQVPTSSYAQALTNQSGQPTPPPSPNGAAAQTEVTYTVISVSLLNNKWNAVLGYQGSLYQVSVGDVLPADQSTVIAIDNSGVTLEKDGAKHKISLVPII